MTCPAKIKVWRAADGEFSCRLEHDPVAEPEHQATGLFDYQTIHWFEGDRRQFTGDFNPCDESTCILPAGHHGDHAR